MTHKLKWAYRALRVRDMADAAADKLPAVIIELCLLLAGWLLLGGSPGVGIVVMSAIAAVACAIAAVVVGATCVMAILGQNEIELERLGLA